MRIEDRILTENSALLAYLADRHPERELMPPSGTFERAEMYRWLSWLDSGFHVAHYPLFAPQRYVPDENLYQQVREHSAVGIRAALNHLEGQLRGADHVLFDKPTVLDPYVFSIARWSEEGFDYPKHFPGIHAFLERMRLDPGVRFGLAIESAEIVDPVSPEGPFLGHVSFEDAIRGAV